MFILICGKEILGMRGHEIMVLNHSKKMRFIIVSPVSVGVGSLSVYVDEIVCV